jgi:hypothetical protein
MKSKGVPLLIFGLTVGLALGWCARDYRADSEVRGLRAANYLGQISSASMTLTHLPPNAGKPEDLQVLALRQALTELEELSAGREIRFPIEVPHLEAGLQRARSYAETREMPELAEKAAVISERLFGGA